MLCSMCCLVYWKESWIKPAFHYTGAAGLRVATAVLVTFLFLASGNIFAFFIAWDRVAFWITGLNFVLALQVDLFKPEQKLQAKKLME